MKKLILTFALGLLISGIASADYVPVEDCYDNDGRLLGRLTILDGQSLNLHIDKKYQAVHLDYIPDPDFSCENNKCEPGQKNIFKYYPMASVEIGDNGSSGMLFLAGAAGEEPYYKEFSCKY